MSTTPNTTGDHPNGNPLLYVVTQRGHSPGKARKSVVSPSEALHGSSLMFGLISSFSMNSESMNYLPSCYSLREIIQNTESTREYATACHQGNVPRFRSLRHPTQPPEWKLLPGHIKRIFLWASQREWVLPFRHNIRPFCAFVWNMLLMCVLLLDRVGYSSQLPSWY